ncbi:MAG TPA: tyrosine-type recombinase/integrase [Firmicutes bacterium]|nr:tyrosine-type recombinase/integrase [Bacillota bacterium]
MSFHALRHTHTTALQDMGLPVKAFQERLGHSEGYVTLGYSHVLPSTEERAATVMDELVAKVNES